eukprot:TRINITY_DN15061_c0_g1_i4.p1 TRINITY_DN15061_c0_g1~~TRINITY_DN15061_c0_g1_i4.p1  ORF type:complete len:363 (-),score=71.31 TRINITY_DN15061_c0_g1_i4:173-1261(-)
MSWGNHWILLLGVLVLVSWERAESTQQQEKPVENKQKYLLYDSRVGRLNNQLRSLGVAIVLGKVLRRTVVVPNLDEGSPFSSIFNITTLKQGVNVIDFDEFSTIFQKDTGFTFSVSPQGTHSPWSTWQTLTDQLAKHPNAQVASLMESRTSNHESRDFLREIKRRYGGSTKRYLSFSELPFYFCRDVMAHSFFRGWYQYLEPVQALKKFANRYIKQHLKRPFLAVHYRQMVSFCSMQSDPSRCQPPPDKLAETILAKQTELTPFESVFLASDNMEPGYDAVLREKLAAKEFSGKISGDWVYKYYTRPVIDQYICSQADYFVGSSVSTFSANIALVRAAHNMSLNHMFQYSGELYSPDLLCNI